MNKSRLETFSDGVIAILITIMVLELKVPHSVEWFSIKQLIPVFISYTLSFIFIAIYWANHHHLLFATKYVNASIMWANLNLLFWLSLVPFATAWMGENNFAKNPVILYAVLLLMCGVAFSILQHVISRTDVHNETLLLAMKKGERKGYISLFGYSASIPLAFINPLISITIFIIISIAWLIPERNIEKALKE
ncbi:MAG: hypothetical protein JWN78_2971 [Bacteroidota bacterium]|nr:hypothetical protein [Bacteroidota bacterium]